MDGPSEQFRSSVTTSLQRIPTVKQAGQWWNPLPRSISHRDEAILETVLNDIAEAARQDVEASPLLREERRGDLTEEEAWTLLGAVDSWASVASYAVSSVYAPQSAIPRGLAGWAKDIGEKLQRVVQMLKSAVATAARRLVGVNGLSIGVSFPWGVTVQLNWPL